MPNSKIIVPSSKQIVPDSKQIVPKFEFGGILDFRILCRGNDKIQGIFFPHFFIERFHAGDEVKNKHLTFSYKRQGILSGKYLRDTYFDPSAQFHFKLWNHHQQLLTYSDPDCTTNCCESINSGLNKDCPTLRTPNAVFHKVLKHKRGFLNKYAYVVKLDNLSLVRRPKK